MSGKTKKKEEEENKEEYSQTVADLGKGSGGPTSLILGKKEEMTDGRKAIRASKSKPLPPPLSSWFGSATVKTL